MGRGGRPKQWPRSWKGAALVGGALVLKGRSFEREYVALPVRIGADGPEQLAEKVEDVIVADTTRQRPS
jgi:hypothetical protein